jgi:hypothetical protein
MTSNELKELVKQHFSLVEAEVETTTEEAVEEAFEAVEETITEVAEEVAQEVFGEIKDENGAFTLVFEGEKLEVGKAVKVRTEEGQEMDAPDGEHRLEGGIVITTEGGKITDIKDVPATEEADAEEMAEVEVEVEEEESMEEESSMEEVVSAIAEAVKSEIESMKKEIETMKAKLSEMEDAPATEKALPSSYSTESTEAELNVLNKDRFEAVMARIKSKK